MATTATDTAHIHINDDGVPVIDTTNTKVIEVVVTQHANHLSAEQVQEYLTDLSLAQIYAALTYYYDHKAELDADIERRRKFAEELEANARKTQPARQELLERARRGGVDPGVLTRLEAEAVDSGHANDGELGNGRA